MHKYYSVEQFLEMQDKCKEKVKKIVEEILIEKKGLVNIDFEKDVYRRIGVIYRSSTEDEKILIDDVIKEVRCMIVKLREGRVF